MTTCCQLPNAAIQNKYCDDKWTSFITGRASFAKIPLYNSHVILLIQSLSDATRHIMDIPAVAISGYGYSSGIERRLVAEDIAISADEP